MNESQPVTQRSFVNRKTMSNVKRNMNRYYSGSQLYSSVLLTSYVDFPTLFSLSLALIVFHLSSLHLLIKKETFCLLQSLVETWGGGNCTTENKGKK